MGMPENPPEHYTYGDYLKVPGEFYFEFVDGKILPKTPTPPIPHAMVRMALGVILKQFFDGEPADKTAEVFLAPFDVRLPKGNEAIEQIDTVVQPDIQVICERAKLEERGVLGAPDLIVEILDEYTAHRDMDIKLRLYEKFGVRCYIIVDPWGRTLMVRYLEGEGRYGRPELFADHDQMPIRIFEGLVFDVGQVFADFDWFYKSCSQ